MLRDILENATVQLKAWLAQKDMEAKLKYGQKGSVTTQTARPVAADAFEDVLFARTGQDTYQSGQLFAATSRNGTRQYTNAVTTHTPHDDVARRHLNLKDKVAQIRRLQALLADIADEIIASYREINMRDGSGKIRQEILALSPTMDPPTTTRKDRRARLGIAPL